MFVHVRARESMHVSMTGAGPWSHTGTPGPGLGDPVCLQTWARRTLCVSRPGPGDPVCLQTRARGSLNVSMTETGPWRHVGTPQLAQGVPECLQAQAREALGASRSRPESPCLSLGPGKLARESLNASVTQAGPWRYAGTPQPGQGGPVCLQAMAWESLYVFRPRPGSPCLSQGLGPEVIACIEALARESLQVSWHGPLSV